MQLAAGSSHCLALRRAGSLWAWGENGFGQLGTGLAAADPPFVRVGRGQQWRDIAAGRDASVGLQADGSYWLWGENRTVRTEPSVQAPEPSRQPTRVVFPPAPGGDSAAF